MPGVFDPMEWGRLSFQELGGKFLDSLADETAEAFLLGLSFLLKVKVALDPAFRRNIENFQAVYQFKSKDDGVGVLLEFDDGDVNYREGLSDDATFTVVFKDGGGLIRFLISQKKDVIQALLNNEIQVSGNLNYIYKLGFMANHLVLELKGDLPQ